HTDSAFIVCQRGLLLLPNKARVRSALGDYFNLDRNMHSGVKMRTFYYNAPIFSPGYHGETRIQKIQEN
uniref:Uncharacterized protein n=1 Tax=Saimiri boliviensis boliviensis TaxID=39432 RepID=A0A2K6SJQ0_SAIBB